MDKHQNSHGTLCMLSCVVAAIAVFLFPSSVCAAELLTLDPAFQEVTITENDASVQTSIIYRNDSSQVQELELFAQDFSQHETMGGVAFIAADQPYPHTLASFLQLGTRSIVLKPGESQSVLVTIENRNSLSPGGHYASVIARVVADPTKEAAQPILPAVSSLILVRKIGGERYHLSLSRVDWQPRMIVGRLPSQLELLIKNDGNIHDIPRGTITVLGLGERTILQGTINESSLYVLPATQRSIAVQLRKTAPVLPVDFVTVQIDGSGQYSAIPFFQEESVIVVAWYVPIGVLLVCLIVGIFFYQKKHNKSHAKTS